jgi:LuxR family maltose regulon positive regulatory protein
MVLKDLEVSVSLLTTKLFFPSARPALVARPRLVERLQTGLRGPLTLISAPAGYGKTTLLAEWRSGPGAPMPVAWLSLDAEDNDSSRFLTYLATALEALKAGISESALAILQSPQSPPPQVTLTSLINNLVDALDTPYVLVLDDYHVITSQSVHEAMIFLLNHLPPQMHLVLLTRADPPYPFANLRARNQIKELRAADLRFTIEETTDFLDRVMGLTLSAEQVKALDQRTEGWVAALQLAALSMQGREDVQGFVTAFSGSHHYIMEYLVDGVLNRQSESNREFLLRTSILNRLTAPLCNTLTDRTDGQDVLENLEHTNLFVVPLDDERRWYRYHHLFADMLRNRLVQIHPDIIPELHKRAAAWCEQNQLIEQAIEHTFAVKGYDQVVRLLRQNYFQLMVASKFSLIRDWVNSFPDDFIRGNPWLSLNYAWFLWNRGNRDAAESYIDSAQQAWDHQSSLGHIPKEDAGLEALPAEILSFRGVVSASKGELERTIEFSKQALALAPETAYTVRSIVYLNLYVVHRDQGDIDKAIESCIQAIPLAKMSGEKGVIIDAFHNLALMHLVRGQLSRAEQVYQEGLDFAEKEWQPDYPGCSLYMVYLARICYERNDLDNAEFLASRALELSEPAYWWTMIYARILLARLQRAKGNLTRALELVAEAETLLQQIHSTYFKGELEAYLARAKADFGKPEEADRWIHSVALDFGERLAYHQQILAFQLAYTLSALGKEDQLLSLLSRIEPMAVAQGCVHWQIQGLVLQAAAWQKKADLERALTCLEEALILAEPESYIRIFIDRGEPVRFLLSRFVSRLDETRIRLDRSEKLKCLKAYASKLLLAFPNAETMVPQSAIHTQQSTLIEPPSDRELELLRLVADGKSNKEIADTLFIATGTVKKHLNNIFGKLGVQNRTQCVARARELNLL